VALVVLLREPGSRDAEILFAALVGLATVELPIRGGPAWQTFAALVLFNFGGAVALVLLFRALLGFPAEVPVAARLSPACSWIGLLFLAVRMPYFLGGPVPTQWIPSLVLAVDALFAAFGFAVFTWNYVQAPAIGRRRLKWVALCIYLGLAPLLLAFAAQLFGPGFPFHALLPPAILAGSLVPVGILLGTRAQRVDVDRLLTATLAWSAAGAAGLGTVLAFAPAAAGALARWSGIAPAAATWLVAAAIAGVTVPLGLRLRPRLERLLFPEREALQRSVRQLLRDLAECALPEEVIELLRERLGALLRLERSAVYVRAGSRLVAEGAATLSARGPLARALERDPVPLALRAGAFERAVPDLEEEERHALARFGSGLLLPIRCGKDLAAVAALGPKRSGDVFTSADGALLGAVAEKASAELARLRDAETIAAERERAERLRAQKEVAEAESVAKSRLLASASHDLRQPLHALALFSERLVREAGGTPLAGLAARIHASSSALTAMFDTLLDLSRLEAGSVEPQVEELELDGLLERLAGEFRELAHVKGLELAFEPSRARVRSDPVLLGRILQNFLANAVRYTERGRVTLRGWAEAGEAAVEVQDTGPGIAPSRQEEVFREFVRLPGAAGSEGLGLGLSIARRTAQLLGHRLELESRPGEGSIFRVRLPAAPRTPAAPGAGAAAEPLVVLVEDDLAILEALGGLVESWGCRVVRADSLAAALEGLERLGRTPAAIVADYRLADGSGLDAIRAIRSAAGRDVPAVVVTGETGAESLRAIRATRLPHLQKPVPPARLRAVLLEMLRGGAALQ
jgi:signal transduction histidine kinase/ActR/RegA family two-component response regulator